jgi:WD40 repeat protein
MILEEVKCSVHGVWVIAPACTSCHLTCHACVPQIWDLREGQLFYTLHGHEGATLAGAFAPAGDYFASAGADEQVNVGHGTCVHLPNSSGGVARATNITRQHATSVMPLSLMCKISELPPDPMLSPH